MTDGRSPERGQFFVLRPDTRGGGPGTNVVLENEEALLTPPALILRPPQGGFPVLREKPQLAHGKGRNKPPRDLEGGFSGYWLVSERLKQVFEAVDPEAFAFAECDYVLPDGSDGSKHYLCDVVRYLSALDRSRSTFKTVELYDSRLRKKIEAPDLAKKARLAFDAREVGSAHVFRMGERPPTVICDVFMREAIRAAGVGIKPSSDGVLYEDAADY